MSSCKNWLIHIS